MDLYLQRSSNLFAENRLLKFVVVLIGLAVIYNTIMLKSVSQKARVVLVPPAMAAHPLASGSDASDEYIRSMARYTMALYLNYSPASIKGQVEDLLSIYSPDSYSKALKTFHSFIDDVRLSKTSSVYYITDIHVDRSNRVIRTEGLRRQFIQDKNIQNAAEKYQIFYQIIDGKFSIKSIKLQEGRKKNG